MIKFEVKVKKTQKEYNLLLNNQTKSTSEHATGNRGRGEAAVGGAASPGGGGGGAGEEGGGGGQKVRPVLDTLQRGAQNAREEVREGGGGAGEEAGGGGGWMRRRVEKEERGAGEESGGGGQKVRPVPDTLQRGAQKLRAKVTPALQDGFRLNFSYIFF